MSAKRYAPRGFPERPIPMGSGARTRTRPPIRGSTPRHRCHRSDLVAVINELAERGLVERTPDPADRRRNVITLTAGGRRPAPPARKLEQLLAAAQEELLSPLSAAEREQLVGLLGHLVAPHTHAGPRWELTTGKSPLGPVDAR